MAAYLSPVFGAGWQVFDNQGRVLAGGLLNTYLAGSVSTPQATWTTSSQAVLNANPIALNSAGRFAQEIWLQGGVGYKFVLTDANSNVIGTWDNISGLNDPSFSSSEWIQTNVVATFVNATTFTVPGNQTNLFTVNRRIQAFTGAGTVYGYVVSSTYSNPNTTVVVAIDAGNLDSGLTTVNVGLLNGVNSSVPQNFVRAGVTVGGSVFLAKSAPIASAATVDLSTATGNEVHITGNTGPITSFGTLPAGVEMTLIFDSNPTVTYNATGLIIPGAQNVTVNAGDVWKVISEGGGNWRVVSITPATFYPPGPTIGIPKNRLINGGMEIWQRGAGGSASIAIAASSNGYTADRWTLTTGANEAFTVAQVAGITTPSQFAAKVQRNNGQTGTTALIFEQPFELNNIFPLRGQIVTVSFTAKAGANWSPASGTLSYILATGTGSAARRGTTPYTGEATPISSSANLTTTATRYSATSTAIATNATQLTLYFTWTPVGTAGADDSFTIDDVQIEIGGVATAFELPDFQQELAKCQRYYEKTFQYSTAPAQNVGVNTGDWSFPAGRAGAAAEISTYSYRVTKSRIPTSGVFYNPAAANAQARDISASVDTTATTFGNSTPSSVQISCTGNASTAVGNDIRVHFTIEAEL